MQAREQPAWFHAFDELAGEIDVLPQSVAKARAALYEWRLVEELEGGKEVAARTDGGAAAVRSSNALAFVGRRTQCA